MTPKKSSGSIINVLKEHKKEVRKYGIVFLLMVTLFFAGGMYLKFLASQLPSLQALQTFEPYLTTEIISADGVVIKKLYKQNRVLVPFDRIPDNLKNAAIATEDHRFYRHWGVDTYRVFGAAFEVVKSLSYKEGFSTITMQLARQLYLTREKKISRKLREILTAIQIEKRYSKNEILEMYLNKSLFGHGAYGVQEAAQFYYNKNVDDLELDESALLIALLKAPARYSPLFSIDRARSRRNLVLKSMLNLGYINLAQYGAALDRPINVKGKLQTSVPASYGIAPYFTEEVRKQLEEMQEIYSFDLYRDGLKVYTSIDTRAQAVAEQAVAEQLKKQQDFSNTRYNTLQERSVLLEKLKLTDSVKKTSELSRNNALIDSLKRADNIVQAAFAAIDLENGNIIAMIGGKDFGIYKFNRATQAKRQPGSAFKPFIYIGAIDNGYSLTTELLNQNLVVFLPDGSRWTPENYEKTTGGWVTLREGMRKSLNLISARMIKEKISSAKEVAMIAKNMGITTPIKAVDAIALGVSEVLPIDIIAAYSTFPNKGVLIDPVYILKIEDRYGSVIYDNTRPLKHGVLSEETAYIITDLLTDVIRNGTGRNSHITYGFDRPSGGKTGTTQGHTDAWFIGFTPQIVAGVWVGIDNPAYSLGPGQAGSVAALPIWANFMKAVHDTLDLPVQDFEMPPGVVRLEICNDTKELANKYCPFKYTEIFREKDKPDKVCQKHSVKRLPEN